MDASTADFQDEGSDYGSDFTPDEEKILLRLLHLQQGSPKLIADVEDEGNPQLAGSELPDRVAYGTGERGGKDGEAILSVEIESKHITTDRRFSSRNGGETNSPLSV